MTKITAIIITKDEELHIERCINSLKNSVDKIVVVDSGSKDNTKEICHKKGVDFFYHKWSGYSDQINWAIKKVESFSDWIFRLDADEILENHDISLKNFLNNLNESINGIYVKRNIYFNQKLVRSGDVYNKKILRIFRSGYGICDGRKMDEHIVVKDKVIDSKIVISDISLLEFNDFIIKHLNYASLEIESSNNYNLEKYKFDNHNYRKKSFKKIFKNFLYYKIPSRLRPFMYYFYRMFLRGGIFDNTDGFYFHLFQVLMYRSFVEYLRYKKCTSKK
tara:strand:+ start:26288 stop:27118 length:831 start_codon:yes stop_codon:yes gene_type:complete